MDGRVSWTSFLVAAFIFIVIVIILILVYHHKSTPKNESDIVIVSGDTLEDDEVVSYELEAALTGAQENPSVRTNAFGIGLFTLSIAPVNPREALDLVTSPTGEARITFGKVQTRRTLFFEVSFSNILLVRSVVIERANKTLVKTLALPEDILVRQPVTTVRGIWTSEDSVNPLTEALVQDLLANRLYVSVRSGTHPNGEIRGLIRTEAIPL